MVKSLSAGQRVMGSIRRFLERKLRLTVNEKKSKVGPVEECGFLGFVFIRGKIRWSDKAFREFKRRIRLFTGRSWFVTMEYRLFKLAEYVRGWMNYYGISEYYRPIPEIDEWLRRRLRMCFWKQWRYTRTKVYNLLKLGCYVERPLRQPNRSRWTDHDIETAQTLWPIKVFFVQYSLQVLIPDFPILRLSYIKYVLFLMRHVALILIFFLSRAYHNTLYTRKLWN